MKKYKQLTSGQRYQIYGLKQASLNQNSDYPKDRRGRIGDLTRV